MLEKSKIEATVFTKPNGKRGKDQEASRVNWNAEPARRVGGLERLMEDDPDMLMFAAFGRQFANPSRKGIKVNPVVDRKNQFLRQTSYIRLKKIRNSHFQIHFNFKAFSPCDFIYIDKMTGLIHLNTQTMETNTLVPEHAVVAFDIFARRYLMAASDPNIMSLVDLESGEYLMRNNFGYQRGELVNCVKFLEDRTGGLKIVIGANKSDLQVFDVEKNQTPIYSFKVRHNVNYLANSNDRTNVALAYDCPYFDIFDFRTGKRVAELKGHTDNGFAVDYHANDIHLATGAQDRTTRIWDIRKLEEIAILATERHPSAHVRYVQDSKYLIVGENGDYLHCYETAFDYKFETSIELGGELIGFDTGKNEKELFVGVGVQGGNGQGGILRCDIGLDNNLKAL